MKIKWPGWGYLAWVVWGRSGSGVDFPRSVNTLYLIQALWVRPSQVTVNCIPCFVSVENTVFADLSISRIKTKLQPNNKQHSSKIIRGEILTFWAAKSRDTSEFYLFAKWAQFRLRRQAQNRRWCCSETGEETGGWSLQDCFRSDKTRQPSLVTAGPGPYYEGPRQWQ